MKVKIEIAYNKFTDKLFLVSGGLVSSEFEMERLPQNLSMFRKLIRTHILSQLPRESKPIALELFINGNVK